MGGGFRVWVYHYPATESYVDVLSPRRTVKLLNAGVIWCDGFFLKACILAKKTKKNGKSERRFELLVNNFERCSICVACPLPSESHPPLGSRGLHER